MLSRHAEAIYWAARYMERAENVARFLDVNLHLTLDLGQATAEQWAPLVSTTGDDEVFYERYGEASKQNVIRFLTFDKDYCNSIISCVTAARENARCIREVISSEMWEQINKTYHMVLKASAHGDLSNDLHDFLSAVKEASQLFVGLTYLTMTHNEAWHVARFGRLLERADKSSRIIDVKYYILLPDPSDVGTTYDEIQWTALLKSASAFEMYRKRYGRISPEKVVEFLLFDRHFPRAIRYCLNKAERSLHAISGTPSDVFENLAERRLGLLRAEFEYAKTKEVITQGLHEYLDQFQLKLNGVGESVYQTFFAIRPARDSEPPDSHTFAE